VGSSIAPAHEAAAKVYDLWSSMEKTQVREACDRRWITAPGRSSPSYWGGGNIMRVWS